MDTILQTVLAAVGTPGDWELYTLLVPTRIGRITVNPALYGSSAAISSEQFRFDAALTDSSPQGINGDTDLFDMDGNCAIQMEDIYISPMMVPTAAEDRLMFSEVIWKPLNPNAKVPDPRPTKDFAKYAETQARISLA